MVLSECRGTTCPVTQHHVQEGWSLQQHHCDNCSCLGVVFVYVLVLRGVCMYVCMCVCVCGFSGFMNIQLD